MLLEELLYHLLPRHHKMTGDITKNSGQGTNTYRAVKGDGDRVLSTTLCSQSDMASCLTRNLVTTKRSQQPNQFSAIYIPWQPHTVISSSRTK